MKRNVQIILAAGMLISTSANSQFSKGDRLIGGAVNVYSYSNSSTGLNTSANNSTNFGSGLVPRYSWFSKNNCMNGIILNANYSHSKSDVSSPSNPGVYQNYNSYGFGIGYFIRNYKDFNQQFGWFLEYNAIVGYSFNQQKSTPGYPYDYKSSYLSAAVNVLPGLYYKVSTAVVVEAGFGGVNATYSRGKSEVGKSHAFNVGLNFPSNFTFGLQFLLGHKQSSKS